MSTRAPREPYKLPRPGSVANSSGTRKNTSTVENNTTRFRNSRNQLTPAQMEKMSKLIKTTDNLFNRIVTIVKENTCRRKPEELNLYRYSEILKDPRQSEEAKYDVMIQLVALKQIFKGERVVDRNTVSIFKNNDRAITIIGVVLGCIGFIMPLAAFGDMAAHVDEGFVRQLEDMRLQSYKEQFPEMSDEDLRTRFSSELSSVRGKAALYSGSSARPLSAALSSMGTNIIGFIPSLISGLVTAFVGPLPVTLILSAGKNAARRFNLRQTIAELEKIINDPENPDGLAESVEKELRATAIQPPTPEEVEAMSAPQAAPPLQSMNEFMNRGVGENGLPKTVQTLSNFTKNSPPAPVEAWEEKSKPKMGIKFSGVNNTFTNKPMTAENAQAVVNSRKGFSVKSGLFTTAKGRQAQANANNARLNAEWLKTHPKVSHIPEATRTLSGKKSILKKGGRKTRKNRR